MVLVLGVSAGAGGARAMLTHSDQPHLPPIDRCAVPRRPGVGVEDPVLDAIDLMRDSADRRGEVVSGIAVTTRCDRHAEAIRAIAGRTRLTIVDEPLAQLNYLRFTGQLPRRGSVLLYDLGSSGLTLTEADCRTDAILAATRGTVVGGDGHDALLRHQLAHEGVSVCTSTIRDYKEQLSSTPVVTASDPIRRTRAVLTRSDFFELVRAGVDHSVTAVRELIADSGVVPDALVLLGGCTRNPGIREELEQSFNLPVVYDPEPESVSARGAVMMAAPQPSTRWIHGFRCPVRQALPPPPVHGVPRRRVAAALAVTAALGATVTGLLVTDSKPAPPTGHVPDSHLDVAGTHTGPWGPR
ncbi:MAG: Hsp70 family protein [Nocardia sp.]|nr:Hsp70 family protein [Nocardia sp.]